MRIWKLADDCLYLQEDGLKTTWRFSSTFNIRCFYFIIWSKTGTEFWTTYGKIPSSNTSLSEAHVGFFKLLMKGIFSPYVLWPFDKNFGFLNFLSKVYSMYLRIEKPLHKQFEKACPACASKRDVLELTTLQYLSFLNTS